MAFGLASQLGYDRAITVFSPEGKLYQVEYAFEAVKRGWSTIGAKCKEGVVVAASKKKVQTLVDFDKLEKIHFIDDHIVTSFAGLAADGRVLVDVARRAALNYRFLYDEPAPVEYVTKAVSDLKQVYTQHGGVRPFGVSLIIAGVDDEPQVFMTEPSGQYMSYKAVAIGQNHHILMEFLEANYKYDLSLDELVKLVLKAFLQVSESEKDPELYEVAVVPVDTKTARKLTVEEVAKHLEEL
ncbi:archaeal proteasome endopeptidase complex subunit alpha [Ignicoccus hospitalis]|uniref:Proteasome subunit alpha n=1 Tax=Ignicoccus hospitalis (strain KIN4/I / DSM 18386 / JCM 14125) TaxID=453591 RepID=A8A9N4_IGNH4|nr:archaeal proteasome endopeptidase complex subunit alpha [Ignicoccus hospitalis]ABU81636.1 Proteasome endopeptidase complex [Ignicoccus hospitalis KIN4/I]HIH89753.1 archaeal proteasome endopeptidase complex subunit alpha [Desulfurococcaceae archaeon]